MRKSAPQFGPIRNDRDYSRMKRLMEQILEQVGDDETHPLADLLDIISTLVEHYEDRKYGEPKDIEPKEVLRFLMDEHGLKQVDLSEVLGSQSLVSEVLAGKREINVRQAKALAKRFGVSPAVFI